MTFFSYLHFILKSKNPPQPGKFVTIQVPDSSPPVAARSFILQRTVPPAAAQSAAKNYCELPQAVRSPE